MFSITVDNVNDALPIGIRILAHNGLPVTVRGMNTIEYPMPVCTTYQVPWQRVLFSPERDANPFFHFMESMWILAGRNDVEFPNTYNSNINRYSDDGITFHGAYGYRLRSRDFDQLSTLIDLLKKDSTTRQAVLQMWDYTIDLGASSKDIPCNDLIFFKIRNGALNMTVCNRSNDVIWGAYGANAVHFSYLQEYVACMVGVLIGEYRQVSDSYHVYTDNPQWDKLQLLTTIKQPYSHKYYKMITYPEVFDEELNHFMRKDIPFGGWKNRFFPDVAEPIDMSWYDHKHFKRGWTWAEQIADTAWRQACLEWLARRGDHEH